VFHAVLLLLVVILLIPLGAKFILKGLAGDVVLIPTLPELLLYILLPLVTQRPVPGTVLASTQSIPVEVVDNI
jgi:hypothetical protein